MLSVSNLACSRGDKTLFTGVSFALQPGEWLHLEGDNGAGKTSLLRIVCGLSPALAGEVSWRGEPIREAAHDYFGELFYMGHGLALKDDLSPLENLMADAAVAGRETSHEAAMKALAHMGLRGREQLPLRVLSQGQKRRSSLARMLTTRASLWILDEPFVALDGHAQTVVCDVIAGHVKAGGMALLTSHQAVQIGLPGRSYRLQA